MVSYLQEQGIISPQVEGRIAMRQKIEEKRNERLKQSTSYLSRAKLGSSPTVGKQDSSWITVWLIFEGI